MHQGSSEQAAQFLRLAVPLMVKHSISPTPYNYARWYSYVSKRSLPLNKALDQTLETYGTCPESFTRELFRDHVIPEEVGLAEHSRLAVNAVVDELKRGMRIQMPCTTEIFSVQRVKNCRIVIWMRCNS